MNRLEWARRLQAIDRRILYLLLVLAIAVPILPGVRVPVPAPAILPETRAYYNAIERLAQDPETKGKLAIVSPNFGGGTIAENQTQLEATLHHLMRSGFRVALFAFVDQQGRDIGQQAAERIAPQYGYEEGKNWVNWGFVPSDAIPTLFKAAVRDIPGNLVNDDRQRRLPVMEGVETADDIALVVNIASTASLPAWLQFFSPPSGKPLQLLYCPTSVMGAEAFPLLRSGQLQGMVFGLKGANEYERLLEIRGFGAQGAASLSYSHFLIVLLVIIGNIAMFVERRERGQ